MLALLGLVGLSLAGTAMVALPAIGKDDVEADDTLEGHENTAPEAEVDADTPDLLQALDFDDTGEEPANQDLPIQDVIDLPQDVQGGFLPSLGVQEVVDFSTDTLDDIPILVADTPTLIANENGNLIGTGSAGNDEFNGLEGDDYVDGRDGNDTLNGGTGGDQLHGGAGDDIVSGGAGDDDIYGFIGDDNLSGGTDDDDVHGGDGDDVVLGGDGNDQLSGGFGDDTLVGGAGRDNIQGSNGDDVIDGVTGEETAERDYLNGSEGNDVLIGNDGDVMSGGDGEDWFEITQGAVSIMDYAEEDQIVLSYAGDVPVLTTEATDSGLMLLADGTPVASLFGVTSFDVTTVELVAD